MWNMLLTYVKHRFYGVLFPVFVLLCVFYLGYHAFAGADNMLSYFKMRRDLASLQMQLQTLQESNADKLQRIIFLRDKSLNVDFLDTMIRRNLDLIDPKGIVVVQVQN